MEHALLLFDLFLFLMSTQIYSDWTEVIYACVSNKRKFAHLQMMCDNLVTLQFAFLILFACL